MNTNNSNQKNTNYIPIIIFIIMALIISYFLVFKNLFKNKYEKMEDEMVSLAKDYVLNNNITTTREIYFDVNKLNYNLDKDCSITSGVIYDGDSFLPYLVCNEYKSKVIENNKEVEKYITLKGDEVLVIAKGMGYYDPGYTSNDMVVTVGNVGTEEGVYNIYYKTKNSNSMANRKVIIVNNQEIRNLFPTITLNGEEVIYLVQGNSYNELGVIGKDSVDGTISNKVIIDGKVDSNQVGEYKLTYVLTNSRGFSNAVSRKVNVIDKESDLVVDYTLSPETITNEDVTIKLSFSDEFNKIIYPDNTEGTNNTYIVNESGTYKFSIYDKYDRIINKEITVDNIDKVLPQGTCNAVMKFDKTEISVNITNNKEISSYEYIVDGTSSNKTQTKTYTSSKIKPSTVKVIIIDSVNNKNEITCSKEDKLTRNIVTDEKGKNCLEGMSCYIQFNYGSSKYPYCSMSNNPNSCGGIGRNGCSITATSMAIAAMGLKSKDGKPYNPWTVWEDFYPINKHTGQCNGGCSGWTRIRDAVVNAGLSAPKKVTNVTRDNLQMMKEHLKKGYPVIIRASAGPFTKKGHYMAILGIREDGYVFLSDSANYKGINKATYKGQKYYVDTWINPEDLVTGNCSEFLLVGPAGLYEGK